MTTTGSIETLRRDVAYALRMLSKRPSFAAIAILSMALGIGPNTAIYSLMEPLFLRTLPTPKPESLVVMKWRAQGTPSVASAIVTGGTYNDPRGGMVGSVFPYPAFDMFLNSSVLASVFCYFPAGSLSLTVTGETEAAETQYVSGGYFNGLGVKPAVGRLISPADDRRGAEPVVVLSYRYSQRRFGEVGRAVGQSIWINDRPFTVSGVVPKDFFGTDPAAAPVAYVPIHANPALGASPAGKTSEDQFLDQNYYWIEIMGRLKAGSSRVEAEASLRPTFQRFANGSAITEEQHAALPELMLMDGASGLDSLRRRYSKPLFILMGLAALILLISCMNFACLLLSKAGDRQREIALRLSLGASRFQVIRQLLIESALLTSLAGILGMIFAFWATRFLGTTLGFGNEEFTVHGGMNLNVLGVTTAVSILTGILFGLAPAFRATDLNLVSAIKSAPATVRYIPRSVKAFASSVQALIVIQIAFSLLLLLSAGLFARTLWNLHSIQLGFNRENVLLFTVKPEAVGYDGATRLRLYTDLLRKIRHIPGVRSAGVSIRPPLSGGGTLVPVGLAGADALSPASPVSRPARAGLFRVGPAFFEAMQIPLIAGREFNERDTSDVPRLAIVNRRFAGVFGSENLVGRTMTIGRSRFEIIGIVGDALFLSVKDRPQPMVYIPLLSSPLPGSVTYEIRASGDPATYSPAVRRIIRQIDSRLAVFDLRTQREQIDQMIAQEIILARLSVAFAVLALVIASVGLYGSVATSVARRTGEIGIRVALGASPAGILWLVLREGLALGLVGVATGIALALFGLRLVESMLFGIKANDPTTMIGVILILLAATVFAGWVPARRAVKVDPMLALRRE